MLHSITNNYFKFKTLRIETNDPKFEFKRIILLLSGCYMSSKEYNMHHYRFLYY